MSLTRGGLGQIGARAAAALLGSYLLLSVPLPAPAPPAPPEGRTGFAWGRDSVWRGLEQAFVEAKASDCAAARAVPREITALRQWVEQLRRVDLPPTAPELDSLEARFFRLAPLVAACGTSADAFTALYARTREVVKHLSIMWDMDDPAARDRVYRALYGGRAAVEEVMLQRTDSVAPILHGSPVRSAAPAAESRGVELRSGDILVSRGGYPTSALIARGNDYAGNFSHVALVHVDPESKAISVIEAHIEVGVTVSSFEEYLADRKLRVMLLRPRRDIPPILRDSVLPHRAATTMLQRARAGHIPYDFTMDHEDPSALFCSEVASHAYRSQGVRLWMGISTLSRPGLRRWLASFGVKHFETQEPSDLEYDPQLAVVAEFRDAAALYEDHIANAVTDAMLEGAERGDVLTYPWYALAPARVAKAYSAVAVLLGGTGPIPEGMSAAAALRNRGYSERHRALSASVRAAAAEWQATNGYRPMYWSLVDLARAAVREEHSP